MDSLEKLVADLEANRIAAQKAKKEKIAGQQQLVDVRDVEGVVYLPNKVEATPPKKRKIFPGIDLVWPK